MIGKNTIECMKSGMIYSSAAAIDGIIDRLEERLGEKTTVIATGGLAKKVIPYCKREIVLDDDLLLKGLIFYTKKTIKSRFVRMGCRFKCISRILLNVAASFYRLQEGVLIQ